MDRRIITVNGKNRLLFIYSPHHVLFSFLHCLFCSVLLDMSISLFVAVLIFMAEDFEFKEIGKKTFSCFNFTFYHFSFYYNFFIIFSGVVDEVSHSPTGCWLVTLKDDYGKIFFALIFLCFVTF